MSEENISTHPSRDKNQIPTVHHEAFIRHAVRNIKGADRLCDSVFQKHNTFGQVLNGPMNPYRISHTSPFKNT